MEELKHKIIHLQHCRGIAWKSIYLLLRQEANLANLYHYSPRYLSSILSIPISRAITIIHQLHHTSSTSIIHSLKEKKIYFVSIWDENYPALLRELPQPPWGLYAMGDVSLLPKERKLAIVGSRKASVYGHKSIRYIMPGLIENKCIIVSGLAKGIDAFAHREAMQLSGRTIAVIAGGFQHIYPKENIKLAREIAEKQLLLSEYPPSAKAEKWQFPARNRIISGLSLGTLVVQANQRSGSLITAYNALDQGRDVFCIPGDITDPLSDGTNQLIAEGAKLIRNSEDILIEISNS